jgi:hypothetical protein
MVWCAIDGRAHGGKEEDKKSARTDAGAIRATEFPTQIGSGNGSSKIILHCLVHLGRAARPCPLSVRTHSDRLGRPAGVALRAHGLETFTREHLVILSVTCCRKLWL